MSYTDVEFWLFLLPHEFVRILSLKGKIDDITFSWRWRDSLCSLDCSSLTTNTALPTPDISLHLLYHITVGVHCTSLCFWRRKQQAKGSKSHSPDYRAVQPGFKQCLLPAISWHKSKLYKRQVISPEACRGFFFIWGLAAQFLGLTFSHKSSHKKNVLLNHWKSRKKQSVVVRA